MAPNVLNNLNLPSECKNKDIEKIRNVKIKISNSIERYVETSKRNWRHLREKFGKELSTKNATTGSRTNGSRSSNG